VFVFLWSTGFVVPRFSAPHAEPLTFLAMRFPIAALGFAGIALALKAPWPRGPEIGHAMVAGALLHGGYLGAVYWAIAQGMPSGVSALIINLQPLLTALLAAALIGESIRKQHWIGLAVGLLGVGLVVWPKLSLTSLNGITPITVGVNAMGAFCVALGTVYQKRFATKLHLASGGVWQYVGASLVVLAGAALTEHFHFDGSFNAWFALAWSVIILSMISISLLMFLIAQGDVARVSALIYLVPGVAAASAYVLFGETLSWFQLLGMAVCALAVMIVLRTSPRRI
jgi:drug/metabolite transporter (DMT)-like permease